MVHIQDSLQNKLDEEVVSLVLQQKEYYAILVERYETKLMIFLRKTSRLSWEECEDILQNAFIKAYINLNSFDKTLSFSSWMYRIVHNALIDYYRAAKQKQQVVSLDAQHEDYVSLFQTLTLDLDIPQEMDQVLLAEQMKHSIEKLPIAYREILILRYMEDKDYKEISDIIQKPMGTVAIVLKRAKEKLKHEWHTLYPSYVP